MSSLIDKFSKKKEDDTTAKKAAPVQAEEKKAESKKVTPKAKTEKSITPKSSRVLVRPLVSEKGAFMQANSKYLFEVARNTNKIEIKRAIEDLYDVQVVKVNIINQQGKKVRFGRVAGKRKDWKKAVITLKSGQRITTVEGV